MRQSLQQRHLSRAFRWLLLSLPTGLVACSGGGDGYGSPTDLPIAVAISPAVATVLPGTTLEITAVVGNDPADRGVSWTVSCKSDPCGAVSPAETASGAPAVYTAPSAQPSSDLAVTLVATSVSDAGATARATLTVPIQPLAIVVTPLNVTISAYHSQQFAATIQNDTSNRGVTWALHGTGCNGGPCGSLEDPTANPVTYVAPGQVPDAANETLTATAAADSAASATVTITFTADSSGIYAIYPTSLIIAPGDRHQFIFSGQSSQGVTWCVADCPSGASCGSFSPEVTSAGEQTIYSAPASVPFNIQASVTATEVANPARSAAVPLTISTTAKLLSVSISPPTASVPIGDGTVFTATIHNASTPHGDESQAPLDWTLTCTNGPCGSFAFEGRDIGDTQQTYMAPRSPQEARVGNQVTITATSTENRTKSASATVTLAAAPVNFSTQNLPAGNAPGALLTADLNGDGKLDVAVANEGGSASGDNGNVSILLGNGDGTFQSPVHFPAGRNPISISTGDLNGDGKHDLIVADLGERPTDGPGNVNVLLGHGDGSFGAPVAFVSGEAPFSLAVGDFNGDLKTDVAVSEPLAFDGFVARDYGGISLLLGKGSGALDAPIIVATDPKTVGMITQDLNGDGQLDLAFAGYAPSSTPGSGVGILAGNGDGTFRPISHFSVGLTLTSISPGDLNGDGNADLVVSSWSRVVILGAGRSDLDVLLGDGHGGFSSSTVTLETKWHSAVFAGSVRVEDFDGDGRQDVAEILGGLVGVQRGNGDGTLQGRLTEAGLSNTFLGTRTFFSGTRPVALATGDFNADGKPDIVVANHGSGDVSILLNVSDRALP